MDKSEQKTNEWAGSRLQVADSLWSDVLIHVKGLVSDQVFTTWLAPVRCTRIDAESVTLAVPNNFFRDWLIEHHRELLLSALTTLGHGDLKIKWELTGANTPAVRQPPPGGTPTIETVDGLGLASPVGDTTMVAIPMVRHWLFAPDRTKAQVRNFCTEVKHKGERLTQTFRIGDPHAGPKKGYGILTVRHQKALFALQEIWQEQGGKMVRWNGHELGFIEASSYDLERSLFAAQGGRQIAMVRQVLQELVSIPVAITNFIGCDGEIYDIDMTGLLAGAYFSQAKSGSKARKSPWVEIVLGLVITNAFKQTAIKPLNLTVMEKLPDIAALLYPKLDYLLQQRDEICWRLPTLVKNLGLIGEVERQRNRRRRLFQAAASELDGKPLSKNGRNLRVRLAHGAAADGEDFLIASCS